MTALSADTYHGADASRAFMSNSQFKSFRECPARTVAELRGDHKSGDKEAMMLGSYIDRALLTTETLLPWLKRDDVKPWFVRKDGKPSALMAKGVRMVERARSDDNFMASLFGDHQVYVTFTMFGAEWKAAMDSCWHAPGDGMLTDLKTTASLSRTEWHPQAKRHVPFYEAFGYWRQMAVYREAYRAKFGEYPAHVMLAVVSSEEVPGLRVLRFNNAARFANELDTIRQWMPTVARWKAGEIFDHPARTYRCEECEYCRKTYKCADEPEIAESCLFASE